MAAVHVDLDGARHIYRAHGWVYDGSEDPLFETGLQSALEILDDARVRATLFVIAEDMLDRPKQRLVRAAVAAGHEIASHSVTHRRLTGLASTAKRAEIIESRDRLTSALGTDVRGFRAPGFDIDGECLEMIADAGYTYDSSMVAGTRRERRSMAGASHRPLPGKPLLELPLPSLRSLRFHPSYSLVVGDWFFRLGVRHVRRAGVPFILLFHLTDFAAPLQSARLDGWKQRLFTLSHIGGDEKRARCAIMIDTIRSLYTIATTTELVAALATGAGGPTPSSLS
jgi:peptidoglycan/xylan/chitin deacetylase (PgdA/CDA1 family)